MDRSPIRFQPLQPLEWLELRVPRARLRPGLKEQQGLVAQLAQQRGPGERLE